MGHDARYAKGSAELTWLRCRRKLENIFLLQWFRFPCLSSEAMSCVFLSGFLICVRSSWGTGSKIPIDEHTSEDKFPFSP